VTPYTLVGGYRFLEEYSACRVTVSWCVGLLCGRGGRVVPD